MPDTQTQATEYEMSVGTDGICVMQSKIVTVSLYLLLRPVSKLRLRPKSDA